MVHHSQRLVEVEIAPFQVSVIIPVYNAAAYVTQAVESALAQPETAEVLLIEDGSPDGALEVCEELAGKYDKVMLLRHPNGENCGAGASRNLGMRNAKFDYIAFLDADDYYLPGRFAAASEIFRLDPACEGVYEAVAMQVESGEGMERWQAAGKSTSQLQTISPGIPPEDLAEVLIKGNKGYFHIDGFVIKKGVLEKSGLMNEHLRLHQDTEFIQRVAFTSRLLPGRLDTPVAMWRVHPANRISAPRSLAVQYRDRMKYWRSLYTWVRQHGTPQQKQMVREGIFSFNRAQKFHPFSHQLLPSRMILWFRQFRLLAWPRLLIDDLTQKLGTKPRRV